MMKLYRIYTEDTAFREQIEDEVTACFPSFTIYHGLGYWKGIEETTLVIEIVASHLEAPLVKTLANSLRVLNKQQAVMVVTVDAEVDLLT